MKKESIERIKQTYENEWVLLTDYEIDEYNEPLLGVVVAHSKEREEIYDKQMEIKKDLLIFYTGKIPEDLAVMF
jgi:hypothetical protein